LLKGREGREVYRDMLGSKGFRRQNNPKLVSVGKEGTGHAPRVFYGKKEITGRNKIFGGNGFLKDKRGVKKQKLLKGGAKIRKGSSKRPDAMSLDQPRWQVGETRSVMSGKTAVGREEDGNTMSEEKREERLAKTIRANPQHSFESQGEGIGQ